MKQVPGILHLDLGKDWRGGQFQCALLHEAMCREGMRSLLVCRGDSALERHCRTRQLPCRVLPLRGEWDFLSARQLARLCRNENYGICLEHCAHAVGIGKLATLFFPALWSLIIRRVAFPLRRNRLTAWKYRPSLQRRIVCISDSIRHGLVVQGLPPEFLFTIHDAWQESPDRDDPPIAREFRQNCGVNTDELLIGCLAALTEEKGHVDLFHALALASAQLPPWRLVLIGSGILASSLAELARQLGLAERIVFLDSLTKPGPRLSALDLFVLPSRQEGLGSILLEVQARKVPILATRSGGIPELIDSGENGWLVPPADPPRLASALVGLLQNARIRRQLADRAKENPLQFSIESRIMKYRHLIELLCAEKDISHGSD